MPSRVTAATMMVPVCQMLRAMARAFPVQLPQLMWFGRRRWLCSVPFDHAAEEADELVLCVELIIERLAPLHCVSHANSGTTTTVPLRCPPDAWVWGMAAAADTVGATLMGTLLVLSLSVRGCDGGRLGSAASPGLAGAVWGGLVGTHAQVGCVARRRRLRAIAELLELLVRHLAQTRAQVLHFLKNTDERRA